MDRLQPLWCLMLTTTLAGCEDGGARGLTGGLAGTTGGHQTSGGAVETETQGSSSEGPSATTGGSSGPSTSGVAGVCGDGQVDPGELCDDGNTDPGDGCSASCDPEQDIDIPYNEVPAAATHNSYSGDIVGERGTIGHQLDAGVRTLEFDVHADDFASAGYRLGHDGPGDEVDHAGDNPQGDGLGAWLERLATWSDAHPEHSPITLYVDLKDRFDTAHPQTGNFGALNALLDTHLGERLYTPDHFHADGSWPWISQMRGRFVVVLTGSEDGQLDYRRDRGVDPAIAINDDGKIVEVHQSQSEETLWLWAGQVHADGTVQWLHHASYDSGNRPAIALNNDGVLVEVHEDEDFGDDDLWYRVGRLQDDYSVLWSSDGGARFPNEDEGVMPSVAFLSLEPGLPSETARAS